MTRLLAFITVFLACPALFAEFPTPRFEQFSPTLPADPDALLQALSSTARADSCDIEGESLICLCVELRDGTKIDRWENGRSFGVRTRSGSDAVWIADGDKGDVAYASNGRGFTARRSGVSMRDVQFGDVTIPDVCEHRPSIARKASAESMSWRDGAWRIEGYKEPWVLVSNVSKKPTSGFVPPTVRSDGDLVEGDVGYFLAPIRSAVVLNGSNEWAGVGLGIPTRRLDEHRWLELQARYDFDREAVYPFAHGDFFLGQPLAHVAGTIEGPQSVRFGATRQLERGRLFRTRSYSVVGTSLSGPAHAFTTSFGVLSEPDDTDVIMTADYSTTARLGQLSIDLFGRHIGDQRDEANDRLLQSTTLGAKFFHRFGTQASIEPAVILGTNFGVVPIDTGYDASATGLVLGQLHARLPIVGDFGETVHRIVPNVTAGRDLAGFQQRFLRDGATPFPFRRRSGFTYGRAAIDHTIEHRAWFFETPVALHMFWNQDGDPRLSPTASIAVRHDDARFEVAGFCESTDCVTARFFGAAQLQASRVLSVSYALSNLTAAQTVQRLGRSLHVGARVPIVWTQNLPFVLEPDWSHTAQIAWRRDAYAATASIAYDVSLEQGGAIVGVQRFWRRLGWGVSMKAGYEPFDEEWNASVGFEGKLR